MEVTITLHLSNGNLIQCEATIGLGWRAPIAQMIEQYNATRCVMHNSKTGKEIFDTDRMVNRTKH